MEPETELEQMEVDLIDNELFKEEAVEALRGLGLPEDEAEMQVEDMF